MRPLEPMNVKTLIRGMRHAARLSLIAAVLALPLAWSSTASAESGAHRKPPPPPDVTEIALGDAR